MIQRKAQNHQEKHPSQLSFGLVFLAGAVQKMLKTDEKTIDPKVLKVVHRYRGGLFQVRVRCRCFRFRGILRRTLQGTNISPKNGTFEDDFPLPKVGYVNSLEGIFFSY